MHYHYHHQHHFLGNLYLTNAPTPTKSQNRIMLKKVSFVIWCSAPCVHPNFSWSYVCAFIRALLSLSRFVLSKSLSTLYVYIRCIFLDHETSFAFFNKHRVVGAVVFKTKIWSNDAIQPICTFFPPKFAHTKEEQGAKCICTIIIWPKETEQRYIAYGSEEHCWQYKQALLFLPYGKMEK